MEYANCGEGMKWNTNGQSRFLVLPFEASASYRIADVLLPPSISASVEVHRIHMDKTTFCTFSVYSIVFEASRVLRRTWIQCAFPFYFSLLCWGIEWDQTSSECDERNHELASSCNVLEYPQLSSMASIQELFPKRKAEFRGKIHRIDDNGMWDDASVKAIASIYGNSNRKVLIRSNWQSRAGIGHRRNSMQKMMSLTMEIGHAQLHTDVDVCVAIMCRQQTHFHRLGVFAFNLRMGYRAQWTCGGSKCFRWNCIIPNIKMF